MSLLSQLRWWLRKQLQGPGGGRGVSCYGYTPAPTHLGHSGVGVGVPIAMAFVNRFDSPLFLVTEQTFLVTKLIVFGGGIRSDY